MDEGSFGVPCYVASTASSNGLEHQTNCYKSTGVYFFAGEVGGVTVGNMCKCLFDHGLTVPCAYVREHTSDKIPVVAHRTQFESPVSSSSSKIHNAAHGWFSRHPTGWCRSAWLDSVPARPIGHGSMVNSLQKQVLGCWICKQGCREGMCGRMGDGSMLPCKQTYWSILGRVVLQELESHCGSVTEPGSSGGLRSAAVGLVRSEDGDLR